MIFPKPMENDSVQIGTEQNHQHQTQEKNQKKIILSLSATSASQPQSDRKSKRVAKDDKEWHGRIAGSTALKDDCKCIVGLHFARPSLQPFGTSRMRTAIQDNGAVA